MGEVDIVHLFSLDVSDYRNYLRTIIMQARGCGCLSDEGFARIQNDMLVIMSELADRWTKGKSSSIPVDKAQDIMNSIAFVIGLKLKTYQTPEQALEHLNTDSIRTLYDEGINIVRRKKAYARRIQKRIIDNMLDTPNVYYKLTIVDGINGFFKLYRPQFGAHEIHITADYPVYIGRPQLDGIEFIEQYLHCIEAENSFCRCFDSKDIHNLLATISKDYRSVPMNIFEPVLLAAIGLVILGHEPERLNLTRDDVNYLYKLLIKNNDSQIQEYLHISCDNMYKRIRVPKSSRLYIDMCIPKLASSIRNAIKMNTLDKLFVVPEQEEHQNKEILSYGERMDDIKYERLVERVLQAEYSEEKISIILGEVHSFADLLDILSDAMLCEEDMKLLVLMLPDEVKEALRYQYPDDSFLDRESERLLYNALQE